MKSLLFRPLRSPSSFTLRVLYKNEGLLIVDKPANLLINSDENFTEIATLQTLLFLGHPFLANLQLKHYFNFINRLDYGTSGLICIAFNDDFASMAGKAFETRKTVKQYLAIVWGHVSKGQHTLNQPIGDILHTWPDGSKQKIMGTQLNFGPDKLENPRESQTLVHVLSHGSLNGVPASELLLIPKTGRRHQLRVHCAEELGHAIAGDLTYENLPFSRMLHKPAAQLPRMMLHSHSLYLPMQSTNKMQRRGKQFSQHIQ
ncbi:RNA pseudouridylate synthase domain-containing protein 1, partial [Cichlidogyrus casuarinus]